MNGLKNGIRNGCAIEIFCGMIILLILTQCSCMSATLPVEPAPTSLVVKGVNTVIPTATQAELIREVCPHVGNVNLRKAADSESDILAVLKTGDVVTVTGGFVQSEDGGVWYPVTHGGVVGFTNARYLCER